MTVEPISGNWSGWWRQGLREGHEFLSLAIAGGSLQGSGQDEDGAFAVTGQIYADGTASITKHYTLPRIPTPPFLAYIGQWNGRVIRGSWVDERTPRNHGPFLLWPSQDECQAEAETNQEAGVAAEDLVPVPRVSQT
jgi:hypothetical protein